MYHLKRNYVRIKKKTKCILTNTPLIPTLFNISCNGNEATIYPNLFCLLINISNILVGGFLLIFPTIKKNISY